MGGIAVGISVNARSNPENSFSTTFLQPGRAVMVRSVINKTGSIILEIKNFTTSFKMQSYGDGFKF
jgi:hypothetical protein